MVDALFDLDKILRSKREQLSFVEAKIMMTWKARATRDCNVGLGCTSAVTWLATKRLHTPLRCALSLGAGTACGIWLLLRSLESSVDRILSLEGSRIQRELANLMLKKSNGDPWVQHRLSKHFYPEKVFDDSSGDRARVRWRYKNFSGEAVRSQGASYGEETNPKENNNNNNIKKTTTPEPKGVYATAADYVRVAADTTESPFDLIFGLAESAEAAPELDSPPESSRRQTRKERRSRRRHRWHHHHEESEE